MPVAATGFTDVSAGDAQPLVLGRGVEHPFEQLAVAGLHFGALLQLVPGGADASRERIADCLEVAEAKGPGLARYGGHAGVDLNPGEGVGHKRAELRLKAADLPPQVRPRKPLVAVDAKRGASL